MANTLPIFPLLPVIGTARFSVAHTTRTTTGNDGLTNIVTGATEGTRVDSVLIKAVDATVIGQVWLWIYSSPAQARCFYEILVPAVTPNTTTVPAWSTKITFPSLVLTNGVNLMVCTTVNQTFNAIAFGGSY